jgi:membrane protein implicated in regulation of membrane protease activity
MVIEATLPRETSIKLSLLLFFNNKGLYIYLLACGLVTAFAIYSHNYGLLFLAWIPYAVYVVLGLSNAFRKNPADKESSHQQPTRYTFTNTEVVAKTAQGEGALKWTDFTKWEILAKSYVLFHADGFILAIPQAAVPPDKVADFESLLRDKITK